MSGSNEQEKGADAKLLDKRTMERYLRNGELDDKALEKHLKSLPDLADNAISVETTMSDDDFVDDDEDEEDDEAEDAPAEG